MTTYLLELAGYAIGVFLFAVIMEKIRGRKLPKQLDLGYSGGHAVEDHEHHKVAV